MSATGQPDATGPVTAEETPGEAAPRWVPDSQQGRRRWMLAAAGVVIVAAAGAAAVAVTNPFGGSKASAAPGAGGTAVEPVTRRSLSSQTPVSATLGYAGSYSVVVPATDGASQPAGAGQGAGTGQPSGSGPALAFTALPDPGDAVRQGHGLYWLNGSPVALLYGAIPAYRTLSQGMSGADVRQLNADLVALKDATRSQLSPRSGYFSASTVSAVDKLQAKLGVAQTGSLALGQVVFLPMAARVTSVSATLGAPAQPGAQVLQATSTIREVTAQLDTTLQADVKAGDHVTITLPGNQTTPGVVTFVGTVATTPASGAGGAPASGSSAGSAGSSGSGSTPTIEVDIKPTDPLATGTLDQAPVQVSITTATVNNALVVPLDALVARASGYAVEVAGPGGGRHLVPVSLGLFDQADALVQVSGAGLAAGQRVVVPKI
jgi:hypothetical protein